MPRNLYGRLLDGLTDLEDSFLDRLIVIALCIALIPTGCVTAFASPASARIAVIEASISASQSSRPELPDDFGPSSTDDDVGSSGAASFAASKSLIATLSETLGTEGAVVLNPGRPVTLQRDGTKVTYGPGTTIHYAVGESSAILGFTSPYPKIETKVLGLRVSPELTRLTLNADNSGTAHTRSSGINLPPKTFRIAWDDVATASGTDCECGCGKNDCTCSSATRSQAPRGDSDVAKVVASQSAVGSDTRPVVTFYTAEGQWCGWCNAEYTKQTPAALKAKTYRLRTIKTDGTPQTHSVGQNRWTISGVPSYVWIDSGGVCRVVNTLEALDTLFTQ